MSKKPTNKQTTKTRQPKTMNKPPQNLTEKLEGLTGKGGDTKICLCERCCLCARGIFYFMRVFCQCAGLGAGVVNP